MEEKKPKIKILVACHKADPAIRQDDIYMPIQVGKALHPELDLGFQGDDTGDNISEKNGSYCELTAMYWAWKNLPKDVDIVGLCHYRRYFKIKGNAIKNLISKLDRSSGDWGIIVKEKVLPHSIIKELIMLTSWEDSYIFIDSVLSAVPDKRSFVYNYFYRNNIFCQCNMFILPRNLFEEYCKFIFGVLENVEKKIKYAGYSRVKRVIGYLAEPLLGFWLRYNNVNLKKLVIDDCSNCYDSRENIKNKLIELRDKVYFNIYNITKCPSNVLFYDWVVTSLMNDGIKLNNYDK